MTDADKIIELGQARNDVFYYDSAEDEQVPEYMKENKIITYMRRIGIMEKGTRVFSKCSDSRG